MKNKNKSNKNEEEDDLKYYTVEEESITKNKTNKIKRRRTYAVNEEIVKKLRKVLLLNNIKLLFRQIQIMI